MSNSKQTIVTKSTWKMKQTNWRNQSFMNARLYFLLTRTFIVIVIITGPSSNIKSVDLLKVKYLSSNPKYINVNKSLSNKRFKVSKRINYLYMLAPIITMMISSNLSRFRSANPICVYVIEKLIEANF